MCNKNVSWAAGRALRTGRCMQRLRRRTCVRLRTAVWCVTTRVGQLEPGSSAGVCEAEWGCLKLHFQQRSAAAADHLCW